MMRLSHCMISWSSHSFKVGNVRRSLGRFIRSSSSLTSKDLKTGPNDFQPVITKYGWFVVPKTHYGFRWTVPNVVRAIEERYPDTSCIPQDPWILQKTVVDDWVQRVDLRAKPETYRSNRKEMLQLKEQALYRSQLRAAGSIPASSDPIEEIPSDQKKSRRRTSIDRITYIHAWNYFFSLNHKNYSHLSSKEAKKEISAEWNSLSMEDKESYREEYASLVANDKDIYKGKIVSRAEKLKKTTKKGRKEKDKG